MINFLGLVESLALNYVFKGTQLSMNYLQALF